MPTETLITFEQQIKEMIAKLESEKLVAQRRLNTAEHCFWQISRKLDAWYSALRDLRESNGLPHDDLGITPKVDYSTLGPTEMVTQWATDHDGQVQLKELTKVALKEGFYREYRSAYNSLRSPLMRLPQFEQEGPGLFRLRRSLVDEGTQLELGPGGHSRNGSHSSNGLK